MEIIANIARMKNIYLILLFLCACCTYKPVLITQEECNEEAIARYLKDCVSKNTKDSVWQSSFDRCSAEAKKEYCNEKKYIIIDGVKTPCDSVAGKHKEFCK